MAEQQKQNKKPSSTEEKMQELFDLMDEKAAKGELNETDEMPAPAPGEVDTSPLSESEAAAFEYSIMMQQYRGPPGRLPAPGSGGAGGKAKAQEGDGQA